VSSVLLQGLIANVILYAGSLVENCRRVGNPAGPTGFPREWDRIVQIRRERAGDGNRAHGSGRERDEGQRERAGTGMKINGFGN